MLTFHSLRVARVAPDAEDAVTIALELPAELQQDFRGRPGQHVVVRTLIDGEEARRTYTPVSAPGEALLRIVLRVHPQGRMSRYLAERLRSGDRLEVATPNGSFTPRTTGNAAATCVAFAAGCGITPVLAVIRALLERPQTQAIVFYGNTDTARVMCLEELLALKDRHLERLALHFVMSREPQEVELYNGRIDAERVRRFAAALFSAQAVREYFVCGPGDMNEGVTSTLRELGVDGARVHAERFAAAGMTETRVAARAVAPLPAEAGAVDVTVRMDGRRRTFSMRIDDETVLEAAARAGIELPFSCRAGVCSTCRTKLVSGRVEMAQNYALEDWELEQGYVLACQSRARSATLELDYDEK